MINFSPSLLSLFIAFGFCGFLMLTGILSSLLLIGKVDSCHFEFISAFYLVLHSRTCYIFHDVMHIHTYSLEQVNSLREIQALRRLNPHPNIIELKEVVLYV